MHSSRAGPQYNCSFQRLTFQHLHVYSCQIYSQCLVAFHLNRNPGKEQQYSKQFQFCVKPAPPLVASRAYGFSRPTSTTNTIKFFFLSTTSTTVYCATVYCTARMPVKHHRGGRNGDVCCCQITAGDTCSSSSSSS